MKIGELAKKVGLSVDAIRFYEKSGLINGPGRTEGGYREFSKDAVAAIEFISHCRSLDIPIPEIKKLLKVRSGTARSCREANEVIDDQLTRLRARIKELKRLETALAELRSVCNAELDPLDCKIIRSLESLG
ncbi:MAG: MerR family transcriptional regulator [Proteobacteria bacterium]|nr:MAG: MerR family transcriptional regulator [Pseudomonadota bacterium]